MLAKGNRIVAGTDYRRLVRSGRKARGALVAAYGRSTAPDAPMRMGVIVSRAVGKAVVRNRVRRRIKAVGWALAQEVRGIDIVIRAMPAAAAAGFDEIEREVRRSVQRVAG